MIIEVETIHAETIEDCRPDYGKGSPPDYIPIFEPRPSLGPLGYDPLLDCALGRYDNRRSRLFAGNAFFRSIVQEERMNGISVEATTQNELDWIIWDDVTDPNNNNIKTFIRFHDVAISNHYVCSAPDKILLIDDPSGSPSPFAHVVQGNMVMLFENLFAFYVLQAEANSGIYVLDYASYDPLYDVTRIYTRNKIPSDTVRGCIGSVFVPVSYDVYDVRLDESRINFVILGDVTDVFIPNMAFYAEEFQYTQTNGEYIVESSVYEGSPDETLISIKDYRGISRNVETLLGSPLPDFGELTNLHTIESHIVAVGTITQPPGSPLPPPVCSPPTLVNLQTSVNASSTIVEMLSRGTDIHDPETAGYETQNCFETFSEIFLSGAFNLPNNPVIDTCLLSYLRTGPERSLIFHATEEDFVGTPIDLPDALRQWDGFNWIPYIPNEDCIFLP